MKVLMFIDLWPGVDPARHSICATNQPWEKLESHRRVSFYVTIPDSVLYQVDEHAAETNITEVSK